MKNVRRLACKFDLDQSERKSTKVTANGVAGRSKFSTSVYLRVCLARALKANGGPDFKTSRGPVKSFSQ